MHQITSELWNAIATGPQASSAAGDNISSEVDSPPPITALGTPVASPTQQLDDEAVVALLPLLSDAISDLPPDALTRADFLRLLGLLHGVTTGHHIGLGLVNHWSRDHHGTDEELELLWSNAPDVDGGIAELEALAARYSTAGAQGREQITGSDTNVVRECADNVVGDGSHPVSDDAKWIPAHAQVYVEELAKAADLSAIPAPLDRSVEIVARLAAMKPTERLRQSRSSARALGITVEDLEQRVEAVIALQGTRDGQQYGQIEPWPEPITPAFLLDEIADTIKRYVVLSPEQAWAGALWIAMTWFIDYIEIAPIGLIDAPEPECGKSKFLEVFGLLAARPLQAANSTPSFIFRAIEGWQVTLLIDEGDTFLRENDELKGIINAGHTRANAFVGRAVAKDGDFEPKLFSVWGAKVLAGIRMDKHLPEATLSRCIIFRLRRKTKGEVVGKLRQSDRLAFKPLIAKLARFAEYYGYQVQQARPQLPDQLSDRAADNWEALFAIAACAGQEWLRRAEQAALALSVKAEGADSTGPELLTDVQAIFEMKKVLKLRSAELLEELIANAEMGWAAYNRGGRPLTLRQLAKLLSGYGIKPRTVRLSPTKTYKGYYKDDFGDAFDRYLVPAADPDLRHIAPERMPAREVAVSDRTAGIRNVPDDPELAARSEVEELIDAFNAEVAGTPERLPTLVRYVDSDDSEKGGNTGF